MENDLYHIGTPRHSGRYPWGSGEEPYQHSSSGLMAQIKELEAQGLTQTEIARGLGLSTTALRAKKHIEKTAKRAADRAFALRLKDKGLSNVAIGERMGINESVVRALLNPALNERRSLSTTTAQALKEGLGCGYLDIGAGVEAHLGVTRTTLNNAIAILQEEGFAVHTIKVKQIGTDKFTLLKVLAPPGTSFADVSQNRDQIRLLDHYSEDGGRSFLGLEPIKSVDSARVMIRYAEDGGDKKDGVIELRRGVEDTSLGNAPYAQVRIGVNGTHYMKGMALYGFDKDFPPGIDFIYNTSKGRDVPPNKVFKAMSDDADNPIASTIRQRHYVDKNGDLQLSPINLVGSKPGSGEEGYWSSWSKNISSQILSKQSPVLARKQLELAYRLQEEDFEEIMSITNPAVKKKLLMTLADGADAAAVELKAAAMPRQGNYVILPINSLADNEVFAPGYRPGEEVVLFRHPHGGIFEAPTLRVNNTNPEALAVIGGSARDAIGINHKVAERLSGADFDGDSVVLIPNPDRSIRTSAPLAALKDFDPKISYKGDGTPTISNRTKQMEMGKISNLITDMTIRGAPPEEIGRAVRHSMVVIDAEKHGLNYKQSFLDNGIAALKQKYQGSSTAGATTLISRAAAEIRVPERRLGRLITDPITGKKRRVFISPETGDKEYEETGRTMIDKQGRAILRTTKISRMENERDPFRLSSGTVIETVYAEHANSLKTLARRARLEALNVEITPYSESAFRVYNKEARALKQKLLLVSRNQPLERQAQLLAGAIIKAKREQNPDMDPATLKKLKGQALEEARSRMGAKKPFIEITEKEWQAIQAGAISPTSLDEILQNANMKEIRVRALPVTHRAVGLSPARVLRAQAMLSNGNTRHDVATALGISVAALDRALEVVDDKGA